MAARTARVRSTLVTMVRRWDRSGPMRAARCLAYKARNARATRRLRTATPSSSPSRPRSDSDVEFDDGVAAVEQHLQELARAAGKCPVLNEQQPEPRGLLL